MSNLFRKTITIAISITVTGISTSHVQAQTEIELLQQIEQYNQTRSNNIEQVTSVQQLRDVSPTDWSYEALRSLSDRYGCISGFPDGTYRGNQPITRNEFAAGLNSCFEQIERSVYNKSEQLDSDKSSIIREDSTENKLANISSRIDELESRTILLEHNQFSPATKINSDAGFEVTNWDKD